MIKGWSAQAFNQSPDSANEIHGDRIAKQYGFKGGLVPGVTVSAYLIHPAIIAWGDDFLNRGYSHVRVGSPLYDEENFSVTIDHQTAHAYEATLTRPDGTISANAKVSLNDDVPPAPGRRGDKIAQAGFRGPDATFESWNQLQQDGCLAFRYHWGSVHNMQTYLRDVGQMPDLLKGENAKANMSYILGTSNWILAGNAYMNPWVHLETTSQNYQPIAPDTTIIAEMSVADFYEKKGHEFVDAEIALFDEADDSCLSTIRLRAIYKLRGM